MEQDKKLQKKQPKKPKKISKTYLENAGLYYLERYASSANNFRQVMLRKIKKSCKFHNMEIEEFIPLLDDLIERYKNVGLLNDESFARGKVSSLRRKGLGKSNIVAKLREKGLSAEHINAALTEIDEDSENADLDAAMLFIKRKKLGQYRTKEPEDLRKTLQREMAALARAGFSYDIAKKALAFKEDEFD